MPGETAQHRGASVLLYDGVCGLCNRLNRFVLKRDRRDRFRFASLQSGFAREALARYGKDPRDLDTVYLIAGYGEASERLLSRSRAVLCVLRELGGVWKLLAILLRPVPGFLLDAAYRVVARSRYRWFGKYESCPIPEPRDRAKFIEV